LVEEVEKKYEKINIIFDKDKINNKTIELKNITISHLANIKDKNKKIINLINNNNTNKRGKIIKSVNKDNIRPNENNAISLGNNNKKKLKRNLHNDYKTKILEKNNITKINSNNKKGKNKCYKKNTKNLRYNNITSNLCCNLTNSYSKRFVIRSKYVVLVTP
jgi:hypothetical protein